MRILINPPALTLTQHLHEIKPLYNMTTTYRERLPDELVDNLEELKFRIAKKNGHEYSKHIKITSCTNAEQYTHFFSGMNGTPYENIASKLSLGEE